MNIIEIRNPRIAEEAEHIRRMVSVLTRSRVTANIVLPSTSGDVVRFNGSQFKHPRGNVQTDFRPRAGNVNATSRLPASPIETEIRETPMPKSAGAICNLMALHSLAIAVGEKFEPEIETFIKSVNARLKFSEDMEIAGCVLQEPSIQDMAQRLQNKTMTRTARGTASPKRVRIHAYSRV